MRPEKIVIDGRGTERTVRYTNLTPEEQQIELPDKRRISVDWRGTFGMISKIKEVVRRHEITQEEGEYRVKLDNKNAHYCLGVVFSDAHIGSVTSDHDLIKDILELTLDTPNTFLIDAGDTFDNGVWGGLQYEQALPPYLQRFTIKDIARELGDKFAAVVIGNHPEWLFCAVGQRPEDLFYENVEGPIFPGMGLLHLKAGRQKYDIAMAHSYWGRSKLNIHNVCHNLRKYEYPDADVFIVGHEHIWGYEKEMIAGREILNVRPGTAKIDDRYARIHGIAKRGQKMGLGIVFGLDKKFMQAMPLLDAVDYVTR